MVLLLYPTVVHSSVNWVVSSFLSGLFTAVAHLQKQLKCIPCEQESEMFLEHNSQSGTGLFHSTF